MTTWVLLRGLAREARHWGAFADELQLRLPAGDRVLALDLPGNGVFRGQRSPLSVAAMVAHCREHAGPGPFRLVALSLGAMVALQWAHDHPREVQGCVLINTSLRAYSPFWQRLRPGAWPVLLGTLRPGLPARERERRVLALTSNRGPHLATLQSWSRIAEAAPVAAGDALRQLHAAARFRLAARPAVPLLLLASTRDRLVACQCSREIARHWHVPLREHPTAGHDLAVDAPAWLLQQLMEWVTSMNFHDP